MTEQTATATAIAAEPTIADIEKSLFSPSDLQKPEVVAEINKVSAILASAGKKPLGMNFNPEIGPLPGWGLIILPITARVENRGNVVKDVAIGSIPWPETVAQDQRGAEFIHNAILTKLTARLASACRTGAASMPQTLSDFLTVSKGEGLATFRELAPVFVKKLKEQNFHTMTANLLRQIFSSRSFAEELFDVSQDKWIWLLDLMIQLANKQKLDPAILIHWKETRDAAIIEMAEDFNLDAFSGLSA